MRIKTLSEKPWKWTLMTIAVCFVILEANPGSPYPSMSVPTGSEETLVAHWLSETGTIANPYAVPSGPTAIVPPVYPALYAGLVKVFGYNIGTLWLLWILNFMFVSTALGLLPLITHRMGLGLYPGTIGASLGAVFLHIHIDTNWNVFLSTCLCVVLFTQLVNKPTDKSAIYLGLSLGLLILAQPAFATMAAPWSLLWLYDHAKLIKRFVIIGGMATLVVLPWIVRDYIQLGHPIFIRDGLGLELYSSNSFDAAPSFDENMKNGNRMKYSPNSNPSVAKDLVKAGEYNYFQERQRLALDWIKHNPRQFSVLTAKRFRLFWFPTPDPLVCLTGIRCYGPWLLTVLSFPGLWILYKRNKRVSLMLGTTLILYPMLYYFVQFDVRYRYPIYWVSLLLAGITLTELHNSTSRRNHEHKRNDRSRVVDKMSQAYL